MSDEYKQKVKQRYEQEIQRGERFWPDSIFKDLVVSLAIFLVLVLLASFIGVPAEPKADPNDSAYIPRPEWYFLFLFQMLKYFPGNLEWIGTAVIPGLAVLALLLLPFLDKNPSRWYGRRKLAIGVMSAIVAGIVFLTVQAVVTTPPQEAAEVANTLPDQILAGQDLYAVQCVECHGDDGRVTIIEGVKGLEGKEISPINSRDAMYTLNDQALADIISYGRPDAGMTPFGKANGGELSPSEISYVVTFMRYLWDDRSEIPVEALKPLFPPLAEGEVPSYDVHIQPIVKRYCISCHRAGKENNEFLMSSYEEILTTGDNKDNDLIPGNPDSYLLQVIQGHEIPDPKDPSKTMIGSMPPSRELKPNIIEVFIRWVLAGMPRTADEAAQLSLTPTPSALPANSTPLPTP
jgi:mono/diheme cytochrome c family protein